MAKSSQQLQLETDLKKRNIISITPTGGANGTIKYEVILGAYKVTVSQFDQLTLLINTKFNKLEKDINDIKKEVKQLKKDVEQLKTDVKQLKADVEQLKTDVANIKEEIKVINHRLDRIESCPTIKKELAELAE